MYQTTELIPVPAFINTLKSYNLNGLRQLSLPQTIRYFDGVNGVIYDLVICGLQSWGITFSELPTLSRLSWEEC